MDGPFLDHRSFIVLGFAQDSRMVREHGSVSRIGV